MNHTPGALRASNAIADSIDSHPSSLEGASRECWEMHFAEIIDRETGARELLEALKDARYKLYGAGGGNPDMDAAIAKAEGRA